MHVVVFWGARTGVDAENNPHHPAEERGKRRETPLTPLPSAEGGGGGLGGGSVRPTPPHHRTTD